LATLRGAANTLGTSASTQSVALPSGWQPGDFCLVGGRIGNTSSGTFTTPSGWNLVTSGFNTLAQSIYGYCFYWRVLQSGDSSPTLTCSASNTWVTSVIALAPSAGGTLAFDAASTTAAITALGNSFTPPAVTAGFAGDSSLIMVVGTGSSSSLSITSSTNVPPSGWTNSAGFATSTGNTTNHRVAGTMYQTGIASAGSVVPGSDSFTTVAAQTFAFCSIQVLVQDVPGSTTYSVAGSAPAASSSNGTVGLNGVLTGSAPASASASGSVTSTGVITGSSPPSSYATGTVSSVFRIAASSASTSGTNGALGTLGVLAGSASSTVSANGAVSLVKAPIELDGSSVASSTANGAFAAAVYVVSGSADSGPANSASGAVIKIGSPVVTQDGRVSTKVTGTSVGPAVTGTYSWNVGDLLVAHLGMDNILGAISFSAVPSFSAWTDLTDNSVGSGTNGLRNRAAWCQCTTAFTGTASVTATVPSSAANVLELFIITGEDSAGALRGQNNATSLTAVPTFTITATAGGDFNGTTLILGTSAIPSGTAANTASGWPVVQSSATTYGTTGGQAKSNVSLAWAVGTQSVVGAGSVTGNCQAGAGTNGTVTDGFIVASLSPGPVTFEVDGSSDTTGVLSANGTLGIVGVLAGNSINNVSSASGTVVAAMALSGYAPAVSTGDGSVASFRIVAGSAASTSLANGTFGLLAALSGTAASVSAASGAVTQVMAPAGTSSTVSLANGTVTWTAVISGLSTIASIANGTFGAAALSGSSSSASLASGSQTSVLAVSGSAASSSPAAGTVYATLTLNGSAASSSVANGAFGLIGVFAGSSVTGSGAAGTVSSLLAVTGSGITASQGNANVAITAGAQTYVIAGQSASVSSASGTVILQGVTSGSAITASSASGALTLAAAVSGSSSTVSQATGSLSRTGILSGSSITISTANGSLTAVGVVSGSSAVSSSANGWLAGGPVSGSSLTASTASGSLGLRAVLAGSSTASSVASGAIVAVGVLSGSSVTGSMGTGAVSISKAPLTLSGSGVTPSSASGAVTGLLAALGSSLTASTAGGTLGLRGAVSGAATAVSVASGAVYAAGVLSGTGITASYAHGWLIEAARISGVSITASGGDGTLLPPFVAGALPSNLSSTVVYTRWILKADVSRDDSATGSPVVYAKSNNATTTTNSISSEVTR